jgi:hypothetical protein
MRRDEGLHCKKTNAFHQEFHQPGRQGWHLLTIETELNGEDTKSTNERGTSLVGSGTRDFCSALSALVGPLQNIFFLTVHYFNAFVPIAKQAWQAAVLGRLSLLLWFGVLTAICLLLTNTE